MLRASGRASPLFPDEAPEAFGHKKSGCAKLDDLDITAGDEQIERAAADPHMASGSSLRHSGHSLSDLSLSINTLSFIRIYGDS